MLNNDICEEYYIEFFKLTYLFNLRSNLSITLLRRKRLKYWLLEHKTFYLSGFWSKNPKWQ